MELERLKSKILSRMDEVVSSVGGSIPDHYSVEDFINEGLKELLSIAPSYLLPTGSIENEPVANEDGSGYVELPADCHRLDYFKMVGWKRPAQIIDSDNPLYSVQFNRHQRGNPRFPIAVICPQSDGLPILEYYSLPTDKTQIIEESNEIWVPRPPSYASGTSQHEIEKSVYVRKMTINGIQFLDPKLTEPLAWIVAHLILGVGNENNASQFAYNRFTETITALKYTTNKNNIPQNAQTDGGKN